MATNFPTSLDSLTNPTASDKLNSVTVPHASQHATLNDAVEALEAKVGVDGSAVTTSHDYLIDKQSVVPYADASARTTAVPSPVEGQMSYLEDTNKVEVYDGSAWVGVGKILQVVSTTKTDTFSAALSGGNDTAITGLSATITPTSASSTILIMGMVSGGGYSTVTNVINVRTYRGATMIGVASSFGNRTETTASSHGESSGTRMSNVGILLSDSPATTSATTYAFYLTTSGAGSTQTYYVNRSGTDTDSSEYNRTISTITVMEVSA